MAPRARGLTVSRETRRPPRLGGSTRARADINDLTELQQGLQHARRKAIYEKLHPEAKRGALGGKGINADILTDKLSVRNESYAADAANAVGETERTVRRKTRIGEQLAEVAEQLQDTAIEDNQLMRTGLYAWNFSAGR